MKPVLILLAINLSGSLLAQESPNPGTTEKSLITISQTQKKEQGTLNPNDEGTNNPVLTGSTEYIQGNKKYYVKSNEKITIIFEEKKPR